MPDAKALSLGADLFRRLVDTVEEYAIFALSQDGRVLYSNAGVLHTLGYRADELSGEQLDVIFTPEDRRAGAPELERRVAAAHGRSEDERYHLRKDGSRFWSAGVLIAIRDASGALLGFGKILRDRTDQRELHDALRNRATQLAQADEDKNIFLATLAHELRTPLSVLMNAAGALRSARPIDSAQLANMIERQVRHSQQLVEDLMDIVRAGRGNLRVERVALDLRTTAEQAAEMVRAQATAQRQQFSLLQPDAPLPVMGDATRLLQVFVNLLNNAVKFTPTGGRITFSTTVEGPDAVARVEDDGIGIPPEKLSSIFDLFSQAHLPAPGSHIGVGIGLALTRELVAVHGGSVQAVSPGVGRGSKFIVRLPLIEGGQSLSQPPSRSK